MLIRGLKLFRDPSGDQGGGGKTPEQLADEAAAVATKKIADEAVAAHVASETEKAKQAAEARKAKVPEKYALKLSEGSLLEASALDRIAANAREQGLSNEEALAAIQQAETALSDAREARVTEYHTALKSDKDLGGEKLPETERRVKLAVAQIKTWPGGEHLLDQLERSGEGSNPLTVRALVHLTTLLKLEEDGAGHGAGGNAGSGGWKIPARLSEAASFNQKAS